jgi:hypothetical protein
MSEGNGVEYRFRRLEDTLATLAKRVEYMDEHGSRRVGILESDMKHLSEQLTELEGTLREFRVELRDTRHRLGTNESAVGNLTQVVARGTEETVSLRRAIVLGSLGLGVTLFGSVATMWVALGGPP